MISPEDLHSIRKQYRLRLSAGSLAAMLVLLFLWRTVAASYLRNARELRRLTNEVRVARENLSPGMSASRLKPRWQNQTALRSQVDPGVVLQRIEKASVRSGCTLTSVEPASGSERSTSWQVHVRGTYHCVGKMLQTLEQSPDPVAISRLNIKRSPSSDRLESSFTLSMWFRDE